MLPYAYMHVNCELLAFVVVLVQGYKQCKQFIVTQGPLENTVNDFWRMVWEQGVTNIVMLCETTERGKVSLLAYRINFM